MNVSERRRRQVLDALRRGTVPQQGLDLLAVGLDPFAPTVDAELAAVSSGESAFTAVRGDYGSGKTFFARWLEERAEQRRMASPPGPLARLPWRRRRRRRSTRSNLMPMLDALADPAVERG